MSAVVPPLRHRVGRSLSWPPSCAAFHPRRQVHDCPATPLSPPEFSTSLTLFAGLWFTAFSPSTSWQQQAVGVLGIKLSLQPPPVAQLSGRAARRAAAVLAPSPGPSFHRCSPTPSRHLVGTSYSPLPYLASSGQAIHLYAAWTRPPLHSSPHLVFI